MSILIKNGTISFQFDLREFIDQLEDDEKMQLVEFLTWEKVMEEAVKRLIGESESWGSDDDILTIEVLSKMEQNVLSGYKWSYLRDLDRLSKDLTAHEHLYWKMYHDPINGAFFRKWLSENNIESNYTHNLPDYQSLRKFVEEKLERFAEVDIVSNEHSEQG